MLLEIEQALPKSNRVMLYGDFSTPRPSKIGRFTVAKNGTDLRDESFREIIPENRHPAGAWDPDRVQRGLAPQGYSPSHSGVPEK